MLCENEGKIDSKISVSLTCPTHVRASILSQLLQNAPIPVGRTVVSCKMLLVRLRRKHKDDVEKIKNGQPLGGGAGSEGETADVAKKAEKPKTPRKRKSKAAEDENDMEGNDAAEGSPKKKSTLRKKKTGAVKEETAEDDAGGSPKKKVVPSKRKADLVKEEVKEETVEEEDDEN